MASCLALLGDLASSYLRQYRVLPKIAYLSKHCDISPRPWLLYFCDRALVRTSSPTPTNG